MTKSTTFLCLVALLWWQFHEFPLLFFTMVLMLDSFTLKWQATTAADLNLGYTSSSSTFLCYFMSFLLFGNTSSIASSTLDGSPGIMQGLWCCTFYMKSTWERRPVFAVIPSSLERGTAHAEMISLTCILSSYFEHQASLQ